MDLSTLDTSDIANQGAVMELNGPTGSPVLQDDKSRVTITLLGEDSDIVMLENNKATNRFLRAGIGAQAVTAEVSRNNERKKFAKATVAWSGIEVDGAKLECTEENAAMLYTRFPWIADQVRVFIADRANFVKASPKA